MCIFLPVETSAYSLNTTGIYIVYIRCPYVSMILSLISFCCVQLVYYGYSKANISEWRTLLMVDVQ